MEEIDPRLFNLNSRTVLKRIEPHHFVLVIQRKSRIIMKDGLKIVEKAQKIISQIPGTKVSLETNAPVCSKTIQFLAENQIEVIPL